VLGMGHPTTPVDLSAAAHRRVASCQALHREAHIENSVHETGKNFGPFRSFQLQAESGGCVVLSGGWIALPLARRTIDRYTLGPRGQGVGTSPGAVHTRAWAGVRGG
jgi:hypothetical protein